MKQKNSKNINVERKELGKFYKQTQFKFIEKLKDIEIISINDPSHRFDNLMEILYDEDALFQAVGTLSKRKGALTEGPPSDKQTSDAMSSKIINEIVQEIKQEKFRFKPIRRIYIDKTGKGLATSEQMGKLKKLHKEGDVSMGQIKEIGTRPLGVSSFKDKIVQEVMRMILNAIYEPEFNQENVNFGFRPGLGCLSAIERIRQKAKSMDYVIEGDIKGAFDNVNHLILLNILKRKVKDVKFLRLINGGLKCGLIYLNFIQNTPIGTTQGSVLSPLLFNVYFNEFDHFINNEFAAKIKEINTSEKRSEKRLPKRYQTVSKAKYLLMYPKILISVKDTYKTYGPNSPQHINAVNRLRVTKQKYKELDRLQKKIPSRTKSRQLIRIVYVRYADDWVLYTNASLERVTEWKNLFKNWINNNLNLELSEEKTKLADLRKGDKVHFLGFQISSAGHHRKIVKVGLSYKKQLDPARRSKFKTVIKQDPSDKIFTIRATNPNPIVAWDRDRVLNRLENSGFIRKVSNTWRGRSKLPWTTLEEPEIVERFNYIIRGYINYYSPVLEYPTDTHFLHYLLTYSCIHTLAQKRNFKLSDIFYRYGKNITINTISKIKTTTKDGVKVTEKPKTTKLLSWEDCLVIIRKIIIETRTTKGKNLGENTNIIDEIPEIKINWRTKYKLQQHCAICGSQENVEYHHVKHIRKGKVEGFLQVMNQLNRKQIPCCKQCHRNIHTGKYDGISLNDLYDEKLIII